MDAYPSLRCVLTHWYQLRLKGEKLGPDNNARLVDIKALSMIQRRQGTDALRGTILQAARSMGTASPVHLPVGAGLFTENIQVETWVRRSLSHQLSKFRVAATYAAIFYIRQSEEVAFILGERVVVAEEDALVIAAARDALDLWRATKYGGRCPRCGQTAGPLLTPRLPEWAPPRAS